ncbi:TPA: helix-turn-helix transcriptional regulator [Streptococcus suis]|nr:helix-turn-helix transcriptional regulator [Streptococcus suis]HEM3654543.1 helix-turn-helix transcriptional regulator [Streptococcus suis]HEM3671154.1 helix-turn-helix transcriptional regulator [Streptococcus suis]HEM3678920.1 helix-turn-helix transcriptional regulator [Streptococcus suis]HEM3691078.1 helix-turn-helix transcriptional regulator [Streptococcus suis]
MSLGNKEVMSNNLKYYMNKKGVDRNQLCSDLDLKYMTVSDWINAKTYPRIDKIESLANYFGINKSDLIEEKSTIPSSSIPLPNFDPRQAILLSNYSKLNETRKNKLLATSEMLLAEEQGKIIDISEKRAEYDARKRISLSVPGKVSAGTGYWQEDDYDTMVDFYADDIPDEKDYDTVAVVVGHSMEPKIKNGDFLFIKLKDQVDLNKIGIFQVDGENYVKKLKSDCLESLNKDYDNIPITADTDFRTIGEVVDIYREK